MRGQVWAEIFLVPTSAHIYIYLNFLINTKQHNYFLFNICTRFEQLKPGTIITSASITAIYIIHIYQTSQLRED